MMAAAWLHGRQRESEITTADTVLHSCMVLHVRRQPQRHLDMPGDVQPISCGGYRFAKCGPARAVQGVVLQETRSS